MTQRKIKNRINEPPSKQKKKIGRSNGSKTIACSACDGTGLSGSAKKSICTVCGGIGWVESSSRKGVRLAYARTS